MKNKRFDTGKDFEGKFPEPGTPADEAWKQMHGLLVKNKLTVPTKKDKRRTILFLLMLLFILITAVIGYRLYFNNQTIKVVVIDTPANKPVTKKQNNPNNNLSPDTVLQNIQQGIAGRALQENDKIKDTTGVSPGKNFPLPFAHDRESKNYVPEENKLNSPMEKANRDQSTDLADSNKINIENEALAAPLIIQNGKEDTPQKINNNMDSIHEQYTKKVVNKNNKQGKFHFGLQWNINFSLNNNSNYFDSYNGSKQYYMWALPSVWAKMDINKKQGILLRVNPYNQLFAGKEVLDLEQPFIASIAPDSVTSLIKSRGYNFGLIYEYNINNNIALAAGLSYTVQHNALYLKQAVEGFSGNILSDSVYAAKKNDAAFRYLKPSYFSWHGSVKYNFRKLSLGAGVARPINNLSSNQDYRVRPLNGEFYIQYHLK